MPPPAEAQPAGAAAVADAEAAEGGGKRWGTYYMQTMKTYFPILFLSFASAALGATQPGKAFETPQQAVSALGEAVDSTNRAALVTLFGAETERLTNPDKVQGAHELAEFAAALN